MYFFVFIKCEKRHKGMADDSCVLFKGDFYDFENHK